MELVIRNENLRKCLGLFSFGEDVLLTWLKFDSVYNLTVLLNEITFGYKAKVSVVLAGKINF